MNEWNFKQRLGLTIFIAILGGIAIGYNVNL